MPVNVAEQQFINIRNLPSLDFKPRPLRAACIVIYGPSDTITFLNMDSHLLTAVLKNCLSLIPPVPSSPQ